MKFSVENAVTLTALAVAGVAVFLALKTVGPGGVSNATFGGNILGGTSINIAPQDVGSYAGGSYPPANSCGCGSSSNGALLASSFSSTLNAAQRDVPGSFYSGNDRIIAATQANIDSINSVGILSGGSNVVNDPGNYHGDFS